MNINIYKGSPGGSVIKNLPANTGEMCSVPWLERFPWKRAWQPTPVFLPVESPWTGETGRL